MAMITATFPGGAVVNANFSGFEVSTDQPEDNGGTNSAPEPYMLFLSSILTCAGFYAQRFCQQRQLSTEGMTMTLDIDRHPESRRLEKVKMAIQLPDGFPDKYQKAIVRAAGMCSVKKAIADPPEFEVITE
ncbi:ribosomal protein S12 methylthiotransferase accessory factor [Desulfuromusa kysingii]|uniref:Ribosomal protein S12 methylthiotransferase accessory factor n=1 Tax=Desulfuromusa kysingii TaxID=37625 RepID=A0A1H3XBD7_9BACT|nr:OsmC family protein [Desulfuromusa kysingii]SDZ96550.1 ribosomal protein S12 methylthiotransferase accessory factor [Desulfuromusa kysingii]